MDEIITDKQLQETYSKLKQVDKFAKSLGFTIYKIVLDFEIENALNELKNKNYKTVTLVLADTEIGEPNFYIPYLQDIINKKEISCLYLVQENKNIPYTKIVSLKGLV